MTFEEIQQKDEQYIMHTYSRFPVAVVSGKGSTATDINGKDYIDFTAGIGTNSFGYSDSGWAEVVANQAKTLQHCSNLYYSIPATEAAEKLVKLSGLKKVLFCNSGAEANECMIKIARKYSFDKYGSGREKIITLNNSFHGRTVTTLAATGQDVFHQYFFPFTEGFDFCDANDIEMLKDKIDNSVCAVMIELVQGEGGVMALDKDFVSDVKKICDKKDILLLCDEVQCGVGRTGKFYSYEHYGILPDVVSSAKGLGGGLPVGACIVGEKTENVLTPGTHGTTFGANPVTCSAVNYVLDKMNDEFLNEIAEKGQYIANRLSVMAGIKKVTGMGMMRGAVLEDNSPKDIVNGCIENGLLILTAKTVLRFLPPLNISKEDLKKGLDILEKVLYKKYGGQK